MPSAGLSFGCMLIRGEPQKFRVFGAIYRPLCIVWMSLV